MQSKYKIIDHTADIGLEAYGSNLEEAFIHAAEGMFSIISPAAQIKQEKSASFQIHAETVEDLLIAWLNKLLY
ncbi:MAG: archease, partial [Candidatus Eremiobacteraeota bacterium]|nr:archease [Candidatus Eremiobacteraeota bacterium]